MEQTISYERFSQPFRANQTFKAGDNGRELCLAFHPVSERHYNGG
jgi:hypothetical protein